MKAIIECPMCRLKTDVEIENDPFPKKWFTKWIGDKTYACPNCEEEITIDVCVYERTKVPF